MFAELEPNKRKRRGEGEPERKVRQLVLGMNYPIVS
jgi:hypothetical protein